MSTYDGHMARSRSISRARMRVMFAETKKQDSFPGGKAKSKAVTTADRMETLEQGAISATKSSSSLTMLVEITIADAK